MFWASKKLIINENFTTNSDENKSFLEHADGDSTDGDCCRAGSSRISDNGMEIKERLTGDDYTYTDCGSTPDEARLGGCHYEPMQRAWIPPECWFSEPAEEYDVFRDRMWYQDTNLTIPADVDGMESGDVQLAYLRKLALAVSMQKKMVNFVPANIEHSNHCSRAIAERIANSYNASFLETDRTMTESYLIYEGCVPLKVIASLEKAVARYLTGKS